MKIYEFRSEKNQCDIRVEYGSTGILIGFKLLKDDGLPMANVIELLEKTLDEKLFLPFAASKKIKLTEILPDLSFEFAYKRYGNTFGTKKDSQKVWSKLSDIDRTKVLKHIPVYEQELKMQPGVAKKYFETYLRSGKWDN